MTGRSWPDDAVLLEIVPDLPDDRGGVVVRQQVIGLDGHDLSGDHGVQTGGTGEHLLSECHSHGPLLSREGAASASAAPRPVRFF